MRIASRSIRRPFGFGRAGLVLGVALVGLGGCTESPPDDAIEMVQYMPLAVVVPKGEELKRAEEYAANHPGHFAYLAVMSHPLSPYGERAGIVARDLDWNELKRGMTVVYLAQRDGAMVGMGAGLLLEKVGDGWRYKSWGYPQAKPNLLLRVAYAGVVIVAFVSDEGTKPNGKLLTSYFQDPSAQVTVTIHKIEPK